MFAYAVTLAAMLAAAPEAPKPSVAMFRLNPEFGVAAGVANLMGERISALLRDSNAFGRVVTASDLESLVDLERQKQMSNCSADSCISELAGALGVDFLLVGSVGKLGSAFLINLKFIDVRRAVAVAAISERLTGTTEEALLDGSLPALKKLLDKSGIKHSLKLEETALVVARPPPAAQPATPVATPDAPASPRPGWVFPVLGAGGGVFAVAALGLVVALLGAVATVSFVGLNVAQPEFDYKPIVEGKAGSTRRNTFLWTTYAVTGGVTLALGLVSFLALTAGGLATVVAALKL